MKKQSKAAVIALLLLGSCGGAMQAQSTGTQSNGSYTLKHRSDFSSQPVHNPFCPIGWVKGVDTPAQAAEGPAPLISANSFVVSSISISSTPLAVINGKTCAEGETIEASYGTQLLKIKVIQINDGSVVLQYQNKSYTIELKRPKLSSDSAPKELPPENPPMQLH